MSLNDQPISPMGRVAQQQRSFSSPFLRQAACEGEDLDMRNLVTAVTMLVEKQADTDKLVSSQENLITTLQHQNALLCRDLATLHEKNARQEMEITDLQKSYNSLEREVVSLKDINAILSQDGQGLHQDVAQVQNAVTAAQSNLATTHSEISKIQKDSKTTLADVKKFQKNHYYFQKEMQTLKIGQAKMQIIVQKLRQQILFHAFLNKPSITLLRGHRVVCNAVKCNKGNAYDARSGVFRAPVSGCYCFMATGCPCSDDASIMCCAQLKITGQPDNILEFASTGYSCSTAHGIAYVCAGQEVALYAVGDGIHDTVTFGSRVTSVTGVLLCAGF
jgi:hypothetical protein